MMIFTGLDKPVPEWIEAGGTAIEIAGWCYHPKCKINRLSILTGSQSIPILNHSIIRPDVYSNHYPQRDALGMSLYSGYWVVVPVNGVTDESVRLTLRAELSDGNIAEQVIASLQILPCERHPDDLSRSIQNLRNGKSVAICMAVFNPPMDLFERQIKSIQNQTFENWICILTDDSTREDVSAEIANCVSSDARFFYFKNSSRLGFYRNFEKALRLVPTGIDYIALADQDDVWSPKKLQELISSLRDDAQLIYSDMRIVRADGTVLSNTYWTSRMVNHSDFHALILANSVTGATSLFRAQLLEKILPFPPNLNGSFHDHWIACVSAAAGEIQFLPEPLVDYIQHSNQVIGHFVPGSESFDLHHKKAALPKSRLRDHLKGRFFYWYEIYRSDVIRIKSITSILSQRFQEIPSQKAEILKQLFRIDEDLRSLLHLIWKGIAEFITNRSRKTIGAEFHLTRGILWQKYMQIRSRMRAWKKPDQTPPSVDYDMHVIEFIKKKIAPLRIRTERDIQSRINLLIPAVDFRYFYGGYITKFNFALRLAREGFKVRLVIVDESQYEPWWWERELEKYAGLPGFFQEVELVHAFNRDLPLLCSESDVFVATTWWTAHVANSACKQLGSPAFLYLIQEYEPFTFPMGTYAALATETYTFPHIAIFSTSTLASFFRENHLGVFSPEMLAGDEKSLVFENAITDVGPIYAKDLNRSIKRLLFYARPEGHASRNMFEMGILALSECIESGYFRDEPWEFYGIGHNLSVNCLQISKRVTMHLLPKMDQQTYAAELKKYDLGLSLMFTPHPSLVPIEMASAGMIVVTNTFGPKTAQELLKISRNILAVDGTIPEIAKGIGSALQRINDYESRIRHSNVQWSRRWEDSFSDSFMKKLNSLIDSVVTDKAKHSTSGIYMNKTTVP